MGVHFDWDKKKSDANLVKHGISFEEAATVFFDPFAKIASDPDHSVNDERFILIGTSQRRRLLFVVHAYHKLDEIIRIISARKATKREMKDFEN